MSNVRDEIKARKLRNRKVVGNAKARFHAVYSFDAEQRKRERELIKQGRTRRLRITFYTIAPNGSKRIKYSSDATGIAAMMEYYETLPIARQLRAAGVRPVATIDEKSTMVVDVTDEEHVMLIMMLGGEIEVREERRLGKGTYTPPELRLMLAA